MFFYINFPTFPNFIVLQASCYFSEHDIHKYYCDVIQFRSIFRYVRSKNDEKHCNFSY